MPSEGSGFRDRDVMRVRAPTGKTTRFPIVTLHGRRMPALEFWSATTVMPGADCYRLGENRLVSWRWRPAAVSRFERWRDLRIAVTRWRSSYKWRLPPIWLKAS